MVDGKCRGIRAWRRGHAIRDEREAESEIRIAECERPAGAVMAKRPVATEWQILGGKLKAQPEPGLDAEDQVFALGIRSGCKLDGLRVEEAPVADIADARRVQSCQ